MDGRCSTCAYWHKETAKGQRLTDTPARWDEQRNRWVFEYEEYEYEVINNAGWRVCLYAGSGALMEVSSHEHAALETAPDFGCVGWEAKEQGQ